MARSLPPFAALRAFEAAARHSSFKQAAQELNLSPSAISHQVKSLEEYLGVCLFHRTGSGLEVTDMAQSYWSDVATALTLLETASSRIETERDDASLVINLYPSLISSWLLPRLNGYKAANPGVDIRIVSSFEPIQFTGSDIDLAIRYGDGTLPDAMSAFLFEEETVPVCSPSFLARNGPIENSRAIQGSTLICCANDPAEWSDWFAAVGHEDIRSPLEPSAQNRHTGPAPDSDVSLPANRIILDTRALVIDAARDGLGIAMARTPYADRFLQSGELIAPVDLKIRTGKDYYLCWPERKSRFRNVVSFRNWLLGSIGNGDLKAAM